MGRDDVDDVIELTEQHDPATGGAVFAMPDAVPPGAELSIRDGRLSSASQESDPPEVDVALSSGRFAAGAANDDEWAQVDRAQATGGEARIVNGRFVYGEPGDASGDDVKLSEGRFAAISSVDVADMRKLGESGAAEKYIQTMQSTGSMPTHFPRDPGGIYLHTKPTRFGDELHAVMLRDPSTRLYHAHLWAFMKKEGGQLKHLDLNRWVGAPGGLSAHQVHLYPGSGGHGAVLCLSERLRGGIPELGPCILRAAQWASGMGYVVRGQTFPYQQ